MNLVKEKQLGLIPTGLKRWPFKFIEHFTDTTRVLPSLAGPVGCCPLNFLNLINLKFRIRAPMGAAYSSLGQSFVCNFLSTPRWKSQVSQKETKCLSCCPKYS